MTDLLVVEDEALLRTALVAVFTAAGHRVRSIERGDEVAAAVAERMPEVVLLDIHLPGLDGISAARHLAEASPRPRVLLLTALARPGVVARALAAPVDGVLLKSATSDELVAAVGTVLAGRRVVPPELVELARSMPPAALTGRELDVLRAAADGAPVDEVAERLHLAPTTVRNHLTSILAKTGTRNRFEAVERAREVGWL